MSAPIVNQLVEIAFALLFAGVVPLFAIAALVPSLESGAPKAVNFRGREVVLGLGLVWMIWALSLAVGIQLVAIPAVGITLDTAEFLLPLLPLVAAACFFGLVDDAYGDSSAKGFKGHLKALAKGRLTTGGLKLLGIGFTSLFTALLIERAVGGGALRVVLATVVIALAANLMNLFDLRPGRATKVYLLLLVPAFIALWLGLLDLAPSSLTVLALMSIGPVFAIWHFDLGERAMLGDAGANAMGALVGYLFASSLPLSWLAVVAVALFALNFASEKVSFSRVIENNRVLAAIDRIGRLP